MTATRRRPLDDPRVAPFELLAHAIWITDPDEVLILWANQAACALWLAKDQDELLNRDLSGTSETARVTLQNLRSRVQKGERVRSERVIYPLGTPVFIEMTIGAFPLPDGRTGLLVEGQPRAQRPDPDVIRGAEAARYAPLVLSTHSLQGETLTRNACANRTFGTDMRFSNLFEDPQDATRCWSELLDRGTLQTDALLRTLTGPRWHALDARTMPDPVTGQQMVVLSLHDITLRVEAERAKDEFIAIVNHELRTPLTAIRGSLGLLAAGVLGEIPEEVRDLLGLADENSRRLGDLVDDLLDVQRILAYGAYGEFAPSGAYEPDGSPPSAAHAVGLELRPRDLDLRKLVERAVRELRAQSGSRKTRVACPLPDTPAQVTADERRLLQVLTNLIGNAIKYGPEGGTVTITLHAGDGRIRCTIEDEGPGVPAAFRGRLFQRFAQADSSTQRSGQGTGLGLYLSRHIVESHGGTIGYEDRASGGSRFFFSLPAAEQDEAAPAPPPPLPG